MRRPLAVFGCAFLLVLLAGAGLSAARALPLGLAAGAALFAVLLLRRRRRLPLYLPLVLAAACVALLYKGVFDLAAADPVRRLAGGEAVATARVEDLRPGYGGDTVHATVRVLSLETAPVGQASPAQTSAPAGFRVELRGLPEVGIGDVLRAELRFYALNGSAAEYGAAKGIYVGAAAKEAPALVGRQTTPAGWLRTARYLGGDNIRQNLPLRLSSVAASMAVGDRRTLAAETTAAYRAAGLSHMLVVSGLHLSVLTAALFGLLGPFVRNKKLLSVLAMAFVLLFMAFTGFTASVVRSGVLCLLMLLAPLFGRRADVYTSLGFAALVLCIQNPYAATDMGLQLSFTATLGAIWGGGLAGRLKQRAGESKRAPAARALAALGRAALVPVFVTLATLPVLALHGGGLSLISVPMNILAVPVLAPIVVSSLIMALCTGLPVVGLLAGPAALVSGVLLVVLEFLTEFAQKLTWAWLPVGGWYALVVILVLYALGALWVFAGRRQGGVGRRRVLAGAMALVLCVVAGAQLFLGRGLVTVTVAGSRQNPSLVVTRGGKAAIVYLGRQSAYAIRALLTEQSVGECVLLVDLRKSPQGTEYEGLFAPKQVVVAGRDVFSHRRFTPFEDVTITLRKQGEGMVACVDVAGYKIGVCSGSVNLLPYAPLDVLVAGAGRVEGRYKTLLTTGDVPDWAAPTQDVFAGEAPQLCLRPGKSVVLREVTSAQGS